MLTVAIDIDDVIWDFVTPLLRNYNLRYNDNVHKEDIIDWDIHQFLKPECKNIFKEFVTPEFITNELVISENTIEIIKILNNLCDLHFVTASHSKILYHKAEKIREYIPCIKDSQIDKLSDKSKFVCDILVDDNPDNIKNAYGKGILVAQPWNCNETIERLSPRQAMLRALLDVTLVERETREIKYRKEGSI